tara:strand:- start:214 stop:2244 length:2031 start_codon:yes stop_codon:yes gene_type:complete
MKIQVAGKTVEVDDGFMNLSETERQILLAKITSEIESKKTSEKPTTQKEKELPQSSNAANLTRLSLGQGLSFGFGDEIEAGIKTLGGLAGDYQKEVSDIRKELDLYRQQNPGKAFSAEMAGAVLPALGAGLLTGGTGTGAVLGSTAARAAPTIGRTTAQLAGTGAATGALYGAGTATEGERIGGALTGAAIGGVGGTAIPLAVKGVGSGTTALMNLLGGTKRSSKFADQKILQALERDGLSPSEAMKKLDDAKALGQTDLLIADLGENLQGLGFASQAIPNISRKEVADKLYERNLSQAERITEDIAKRSDIEGPFGLQYIDDLSAKQSALAQPAYKKAYEKNLPASYFKEFFTGPRSDLFIQASKEGRKLMRAEGKDIPDLAKTIKTKELSEEFFKGNIPTRYLHQIKRGLDSIINKETKDFKLSPYGVTVTKAKNEFNDLIGSLNPAYKKANKDFADDARLKDAFNSGLKYKSLSVDGLNKTFNKMNSGEKEAFRVGMVSEIRKQSENVTENRNFVDLVFGSKQRRNVLKKVFPDSDSYKDFEKIIQLENKKLATKNRVLGNSQTARNQREILEAGADTNTMIDLMMGLATGDARQIARTGAKGIGARVGGMNPESAEMIAKKLFNSSSSEQQKILSGLTALEIEQVKKAQNILLNPNVYSSLVSGTIARESQN